MARPPTSQRITCQDTSLFWTWSFFKYQYFCPLSCSGGGNFSSPSVVHNWHRQRQFIPLRMSIVSLLPFSSRMGNEGISTSLYIKICLAAGMGKSLDPMVPMLMPLGRMGRMPVPRSALLLSCRRPVGEHAFSLCYPSLFCKKRLALSWLPVYILYY